MKTFKLIIIGSLLLLSGSVSSQELANGYYNYVMNRFNLNPAFAGNSGKMSAMLNTKTAQSGFDNAPRNTFLGFHAPINQQQAVGLRMVLDKRGGFEVAKYDAVYSYEVKINDVSDLRFGMSAGIVRRMLNSNSLKNQEFLNQADPNLASGYFDETNSIIGIGLLYDYKNFQVGFSAPNLVEGSEDISNFLVGTFGYKHLIKNSKFTLSPLLIYQNLPVIDNQFDALVKVDYSEKIWFQAGYQSTNNLNFGLGFDLGPFGVGYSYEMNNSELNNIASGSNEIVITIGFDSHQMKKGDATIKTLDEHVEKLNAIISDKNNTYSKEDAMTEIERIKIELNSMERSNNKKKAKEIEMRLIAIDAQITELENKYAK
jgi:type IX secretion system PorP/SprF family membrane protein